MASVDPNNQQVIFLGEGAKRTRGRDAQRINILIAKAVANAVRSTLGPKGMDKMIVDELGDVTISNDGATILQEMSIEHPAGKMMVEIAKTQDDEVGDGTTTATVLAGTLLEKSEKLLDDDIHSSVIIKGYRMAARKAKEAYTMAAEDVTLKDTELLKELAMTSMTGKASEGGHELSDLVVTAIKQIAEEEIGKVKIDLDQVKIEKKVGASLADSELIKGVLIDKEIVHSSMPKRITDAKIALVEAALEIKEPESDAKIEISSPDQLQAFLDQEESQLRAMVSAIQSAGANVVFCQKGIDDLAQHFLAKQNIVAVRRVKKSDMDALAKATDAKIVSRFKDLTAKDLGFAGVVEERKIAGDNMVFVFDCKNPKSVSLLVRGGSEHVVDEAERAVKDAIGAVSASLRTGKFVIGGGASEMQVAHHLREYAKTIGGREQLAIEAFAEALEIIPRTLAESAGMDPIDTLVALRSKHSEKAGKAFGVDVYEGKIVNMQAKKVIEPLAIKTQALTSASEVAEMILRIDDIIAGSSKSKGMPGGMPPGGMGDMGGMDM